VCRACHASAVDFCTDCSTQKSTALAWQAGR